MTLEEIAKLTCSWEITAMSNEEAEKNNEP